MSKKHKVKIVYREKKDNEETELNKTRSEINSILAKKNEAVKIADERYKKAGFLGKIGVALGSGAAQLQYNKAIGERSRYLGAQHQIRSLNQNIKIQNLQIEANKKKAELERVRKEARNEIKIDLISSKDIFG